MLLYLHIKFQVSRIIQTSFGQGTGLTPTWKHIREKPNRIRVITFHYIKPTNRYMKLVWFVVFEIKYDNLKLGFKKELFTIHNEKSKHSPLPLRMPRSYFDSNIHLTNNWAPMWFLNLKMEHIEPLGYNYFHFLFFFCFFFYVSVKRWTKQRKRTCSTVHHRFLHVSHLFLSWQGNLSLWKYLYEYLSCWKLFSMEIFIWISILLKRVTISKGLP